ncbi:MAG TPA: hypothetical protein VE093_22850 [Polyangiaceae bacterium]|jgi:hypothetical protein|nr:hypothetical protein [Polyangiaceae bacterium]
MNRRTTALGLASALTALAPTALAQEAVPTPFSNDYGQTETARSAGLASAARALGNGTSGLFLNPASIALNRVYHVEGLLQATPEAGRLTAGAAIVDSIMNRHGLAGGVAVLGGLLNAGPSDWSTFELRTALAYPISDKLLLGVAPRYVSITHAFPAVEGDQNQNDLVSLEIHAFTFDAGVTIRPSDSLHIALVGQNLASNRRSLYPTSIGGGVGFATEVFSLEVDGLADFGSYDGVTTRFMGGGEVLVGEHFPIRLGYKFDQGAKLHKKSAGLHEIAGGLGYIGTEFAIEASIQRTLSDPGATTIVVGLAYYVETAGFMKAATEGFEQ